MIDIVGPIYRSFVSALAFNFFAFLSFMKSRWQKRHIHDFVLWQKTTTMASRLHCRTSCYIAVYFSGQRSATQLTQTYCLHGLKCHLLKEKLRIRLVKWTALQCQDSCFLSKMISSPKHLSASINCHAPWACIVFLHNNLSLVTPESFGWENISLLISGEGRTVLA